MPLWKLRPASPSSASRRERPLESLRTRQLLRRPTGPADTRPTADSEGIRSGLCSATSMNDTVASVRRGLALLLALVSWVWTGGVLAAALLWGLALRCDEACDGDGWRRSEDGWQWDAVVALGVAAFLAGAALVVSVWRRRAGYALAAFIAGLAAVLAFATALSPEWREHLGRVEGDEALLFLSGVAAPLAAVLLTIRGK